MLQIVLTRNRKPICDSWCYDAENGGHSVEFLDNLVNRFCQIGSSLVFRPWFSLQRLNHGHPILYITFNISFGPPWTLLSLNTLNKCIESLFKLLSSCHCEESNWYLDRIHSPLVSCDLIKISKLQNLWIFLSILIAPIVRCVGIDLEENSELLFKPLSKFSL